MPTADSVQGVWSWRRAAILALGIGIRPCTGAIGVLFVANGLGLMWAGVLSITVSALAALAVSSRDLATRIAGAADNSWASIAQTVIGLTGAALVFILGSTFFYYSFGTPAPF
jgi:nickel/cobalt transporter (NicO) family protein